MFFYKMLGAEFVHSSAEPSEGNFWHKKSPHPEGCELGFDDYHRAPSEY
jgi:hypothetical protein